MRKPKEVLKLRYELKLNQTQFARSCAIAVSTVQYRKRAGAAKLGWALPDGMTALFRCPGTKTKDPEAFAGPRLGSRAPPQPLPHHLAANTKPERRLLLTRPARRGELR
jgi:hypothetical protein